MASYREKILVMLVFYPFRHLLLALLALSVLVCGPVNAAPTPGDDAAYVTAPHGLTPDSSAAVFLDCADDDDHAPFAGAEEDELVSVILPATTIPAYAPLVCVSVPPVPSRHLSGVSPPAWVPPRPLS